MKIFSIQERIEELDLDDPSIKANVIKLVSEVVLETLIIAFLFGLTVGVIL